MDTQKIIDIPDIRIGKPKPGQDHCCRCGRYSYGPCPWCWPAPYSYVPWHRGPRLTKRGANLASGLIAGALGATILGLPPVAFVSAVVVGGVTGYCWPKHLA